MAATYANNAFDLRPGLMNINPAEYVKENNSLPLVEAVLFCSIRKCGTNVVLIQAVPGLFKSIDLMRRFPA